MNIDIITIPAATTTATITAEQQAQQHQQQLKMASSICMIKNIDANKITFDPVRKNALGGNVVYLKHNNAPRLQIQTPAVAAPFGMSTFTDEKTGAVKYSLDISFRGMESEPKIKEFHEKMNSIDEMLIKEGVLNSKEWFGKKMSNEVIQEFYRPLVKKSKDPEKYAPTMKFKIPQGRDGSISVDCYNHEKQKVDIMEALVPGMKIQGILECSSVWFVGKNMYGISWRLIQVKLHKSEKISGFSFLEDSDDDEAENSEEDEEVEEDDL